MANKPVETPLQEACRQEKGLEDRRQNPLLQERAICSIQSKTQILGGDNNLIHAITSAHRAYMKTKERGQHDEEEDDQYKDEESEAVIGEPVAHCDTPVAETGVHLRRKACLNRTSESRDGHSKSR